MLPLVAALAVIPSAAQAAGTQDERPYEPPIEQCTIVGTPGDDRLTGTPGDDVICGLGGNDILIGLSGDDELYGGDGDDRLYGGAGDDLLVGGPGADIVRGGPGDDTMEGPGESSPDGDSLEGEEGVDTIVNGGYGVKLNVSLAVQYSLPRGTKIEWFFVRDPGATQCVEQTVPNWTYTVKRGAEIVDSPLLTTSLAGDCGFRNSYATWQVRVTPPPYEGAVSTGSVFIQTSTLSTSSTRVTASCRDWKGSSCQSKEWGGPPSASDAIVPLSLF